MKTKIPKKIKLISFSDIIEKQMRDPEFRKEIEIEKKKLEISLAITDLRKERKMSQAKLADITGMKQSAIGRIETGNENLTLETLNKIAIALGSQLIVDFKVTRK